MLRAIVTFLGLKSALTSAAVIGARQQACYTGALVLGLHGCGDLGNAEGSERAYTNAIVSSIPGSFKYRVPYDGNCGTNYQASVNAGVTILKQTIATYVSSCPNSRIVIVGYSEGAHVTLNTLGGYQTTGASPLASTYNKNIAAVVVMGDPSRSSSTASYNKGTSTSRAGIFGRGSASTANLNAYASKLVSYCDLGDVFCAPSTSGSEPNVHGSYFRAAHYVNAGVSFAVQRFNAA